MNVKQLKLILNSMDDDLSVEIQTSEPSVGPTSTVTIKGIAFGLDWDMGKVFIIPSENIIKEKCGEN